MSGETEVMEGTNEIAANVEVIPAQTPANVSNAIDISTETIQALESIDGIVVGDIGLKVSRVPIEKYKASTTKIDRIGFINSKVIAIKTHFFDGVGSILCFGKKCCEIGGIPAVRYLFPVVVYSTDNEGEVVSPKLDLRILSAGEDLYKSIITINKATASMGGIDAVDLLVTCTDDKYQKLTLNQAGPALWKKSSKATQYVADRWVQDAEFAYMAVARKMDESSFLAAMGAEVPGQPAANQTINTDQKSLQSFFED